MEDSTTEIKNWLKANSISTPSLHVVLGSGLASALNKFDTGYLAKKGWKNVGEVAFSQIAGISSSTAPGHKAAYKFFERNGKVVSFQSGRLHGYEGHSPKTVVKPVIAMCELGVKKFILTNASGSLQTYMKAGTVMIITDHVNFTGQNPLTGPNLESLGPRFPDMGNVYSKNINSVLKNKLELNEVDVHEGIYIGVNGPSFETHAETKLFSDWGMGAVGMSTVFEAIALKHRGAETGGLSFLANMGAGIGDESEVLTGEDVIVQGEKKSPAILKAIFEASEDL